MSKTKALTMTKPRKDYKLLYYALPFMIIVLLFNYVPIFGWIYAFFDYVPGVKLNDSEFVGLEYFKLIFTDANVWRSLTNTFIFAILGILFSPLPMFFAILLNEVKNGPVRKIVQTFTTLPNFISWVIIFSLAFTLFSSDGLITTMLLKIGIGTEGQNLLGDGKAVYIFQSLLGLWKGLGWSSIIYLAAIAGIDQEQYEAARVDGAGYFRCAIHITMPAMIGTFVVLFILNIGNFLNTGYEQYLLFKNSMTADNIEVLDLYAYRIGLENMDYSYGVAISIIKSVVSVILVTFANLVAKKARGSAVV
jgi:ABC superfamily ATP binding cassette transporter, membrane protein